MQLEMEKSPKKRVAELSLWLLPEVKHDTKETVESEPIHLSFQPAVKLCPDSWFSPDCPGDCIPAIAGYNSKVICKQIRTQQPSGSQQQQTDLPVCIDDLEKCNWLKAKEILLPR